MQNILYQIRNVRYASKAQASSSLVLHVRILERLDRLVHYPTMYGHCPRPQFPLDSDVPFPRRP